MDVEVKTCYLTRMENRSQNPWRGILEYRDPSSSKKHVVSKVFDSEKVKTKAQAERALKKWRDESIAMLNAKPAPKPIEPDATSKVSEYVSKMTQQRISAERLEESTQYGYRFSLAHVEEGFSDIRLCDLKPSHVSKWIANMNDAGLSPSTISKAYRLLKQACEIAVDDELIPRNPCTKKAVRLPKSRKEQPNVLDERGRSAIMSALSVMERTPTVLAAYIALFTGARRGEICALTWKDVDLDGATIAIRRTIGIKQGGTYLKQPKSERGNRVIPMPSQLVPILAAHRAFMHEDWLALLESAEVRKVDESAFDSLYVLGTLDGRYANPTRLGKSWQTLAESLNLMGTEGRIVTLHDLRHTYATIAVADNADVKSVSSNLGHANTAITLDIYAADDAEAKRRTAETVGRAFSMERGE